MVTLAVLIPAGSEGHWYDLLPICIALAVIGFGVGLTWPHLLTGIFKQADTEDQNLASASVTMVQLFTTALGAALAGMVANMAGLTNPGGFAGTAHAALWLFPASPFCPHWRSCRRSLSSAAQDSRKRPNAENYQAAGEIT